MKFNMAHIDILIAHMMSNGHILEAAARQIEAHMVKNAEIGGELYQTILVDTLLQHWGTYQTVPDEASVIVGYRGIVNQYISSEEKRDQLIAMFIDFQEFRRTVDDRSEGLARGVLQWIHETCVIKPATKKLLDDARQTGILEGLSGRIAELESRQQAAAGGLSTSGIFDLDLTDCGERRPTYIPFLDAHLGGGRGPSIGSCMGIIAPQGGGKTTFGIQLAVAQALAGQHAQLVLAEEGLSRPIQLKLMACATGIPYDLLETRSVLEAADAVKMSQLTVAKRLAVVNEHLHVFDMVRSATYGVAPILAEVRTLVNSGKDIKYVYVDWAGIIADVVSKETGRTLENELKSLSNELARLAQSLNLNVAVSQQMAGANVQKGPFAENDHYCAADCRMFTAPMKYVFVVNIQDTRTGFSLLKLAKARDESTAGTKLVTKLRGEIASFEDVSDRFMIQGKNFLPVRRRQDQNAIPKE